MNLSTLPMNSRRRKHRPCLSSIVGQAGHPFCWNPDHPFHVITDRFIEILMTNGLTLSRKEVIWFMSWQAELALS